ncbi:PTS sorbitol transporter subunit IIA [Lactobacillus sp. CBA3605]|uniref:PTS glucitol/sorbitol transporter subunit IIA n=1 Tax=Lactobacillus sp. CBA3605 TaxID=2099788 RepID=UPI000CFB3D4F|nr:PTS glucitol/sorbitol transporter subunit IIA [Lactobacillus sp. CBA3605]AVK61454.1 PTS sorbitol transporter subunit IIA [Lactobacillus sp. CBA3605]
MKKQKKFFSTKVVEIGAETVDFKMIDMAILFGDEAPAALRPSCFIIKIEPIKEQIISGMMLKIDEQKYIITSVGTEVQANLGRLGHMAISFTGATRAKLPGTLYVTKGEYPNFKVGSRIEILGATS